MKEKMKAAVFEGVGNLAIKEVDTPKIIKEDEVIIEVDMCAICGTDIHITANPPGYEAAPGTVLGHEFAGRVAEVGRAVKDLKPGDRVVANPNDYCGHCRYCKMNLPNFCENMVQMGVKSDGAFAEYVKTTEKCVFKVPDGLSAKEAALAEPMSCALNGLEQIRVNPGESVLVCGAGAIGLLHIELLKESGAYPIIVSEPVETRRKMALKVGADFAVDPTKEDLNAFVLQKTGMGVDYAIDVVGSQFGACLDNVRNGGTVLLFGLNERARMDMQQSEVTTKQVRVYGTWIANATFPKVIQILGSRKLDLESLVTHVYPLEKLPEALELLRGGEGIKAVIDMKL
ncbi:MAG: zinc-dependent alcohol dehydrogenase family protein [Christensenellaceae bacterium]